MQIKEPNHDTFEIQKDVYNMNIVSSVARGQSAPLTAKNLPKKTEENREKEEKIGKREKSGKKKEKSGRKGKNREGFFTLPPFPIQRGLPTPLNIVFSQLV